MMPIHYLRIYTICAVMRASTAGDNGNFRILGDGIKIVFDFEELLIHFAY